jgi:hypothetical protein
MVAGSKPLKRYLLGWRRQGAHPKQQTHQVLISSECWRQTSQALTTGMQATEGPM